MSRLTRANRWAVGGAAVLVLLTAAFLWRPQPVARAQAGEKRWEYKVVVFSHKGDYRSDPDGSNNAEQFTTQYQALAKDGWEYVGPVCTPGGYSRSFIAFRRPSS
jgi:hypothetical protein